MISVSNEFKAAINGDSRLFDAKIFVNDSEITTNNIVSIDYDLSVMDSSDFSIGAVNAADIKVELNNYDGAVTDLITEGKSFKCSIGVETEAGFEYVPLGVFKADDVTVIDNIITVKAMDMLAYMESEYKNALIYPATLKDILEDICLEGGCEFSDLSFPNSNITFETKPDITGITCRELVAYIAQLAGGFAVINRNGKLEIRNYNTTAETIGRTQYFSIKVGKSEFEPISLVSVMNGETELVHMGTAGNVFTIQDNPFVKDYDTADLIIEALYSQLSAVSYKPIEIEWQGNPAFEAGDIVNVETKDNTYKTILADMKLSFEGGFKATASSSLTVGNERGTKGNQSYTDKKIDKIEKEVEEIKSGTNKEVHNTIIEVTKEAVVSADVIEASAVFSEDIFVERLATNLRPYKCIPNIEEVEGELKWVGEAHTFTSSTTDTLRGSVEIEGIGQKFKEYHLKAVDDLSNLTLEDVQPLIINGRQVYYTSILGGSNPYEYFTFIEPKTKYPSMSDENAAMFKVYIRTYEGECTKAEFEFTKIEGNTYKIRFILGAGDENGNGKIIIEKDGDYGYFKMPSRLDGLERGVRVGDEVVECCNDGVNWFKMQEIYIVETKPETFIEDAIYLVMGGE